VNSDTERHARFGVPEWLTAYRGDWLRPDIIAGLTAAAVVIPKSIAYTSVAGLPLQVGLYTAFVPMILYALLGTSRVLSVSTSSTIAILVAVELAAAAPGGDASALLTATATLTLLVGAMLAVACLLRLGFVANFISEPVLIGFKAGIGVVIVLDQLPKLIGTHITKGRFLHNVWETIASVAHAHPVTVVIGVLTMALLVVMEHYAPKAPAPLVAVGLGIGLTFCTWMRRVFTWWGISRKGCRGLRLRRWR
jgi:MFS superfamily sulfate permease-like transporter